MKLKRKKSVLLIVSFFVVGSCFSNLSGLESCQIRETIREINSSSKNMQDGGIFLKSVELLSVAERFIETDISSGDSANQEKFDLAKECLDSLLGVCYESTAFGSGERGFDVLKMLELRVQWLEKKLLLCDEAREELEILQQIAFIWARDAKVLLKKVGDERGLNKAENQLKSSKQRFLSYPIQEYEIEKHAFSESELRALADISGEISGLINTENDVVIFVGRSPYWVHYYSMQHNLLSKDRTYIVPFSGANDVYDELKSNNEQVNLNLEENRYLEYIVSSPIVDFVDFLLRYTGLDRDFLDVLSNNRSIHLVDFLLSGVGMESFDIALQYACLVSTGRKIDNIQYLNLYPELFEENFRLQGKSVTCLQSGQDVLNKLENKYGRNALSCPLKRFEKEHWGLEAARVDVCTLNKNEIIECREQQIKAFRGSQ